MQYSKNLKLNLPERNDQYNLDHWNENTNNLDDLVYQNQLSVSQNQNDISKIFNGLDTKNVNDTNSVYYKLMELVYPVGCLYWSSDSTNPSQLFGGTWAQIKDKFILSAGDTYKNNDIGGSATVTLTVNQIPSHKHSFTPSGTVSSHTHGLNDHKHTFSGTTGGSSANISINTATGSFLTDNAPANSGDGYIGAQGFVKHVLTNNTALVNLGGSIDTVGNGGDGMVVLDHNHSITQTAHSHSFSGTTVGNSGTTTPTQPTFTGSNGTTDASGSGNAHDNMPPYVVKYCWERTK